MSQAFARCVSLCGVLCHPGRDSNPQSSAAGDPLETGGHAFFIGMKCTVHGEVCACFDYPVWYPLYIVEVPPKLSGVLCPLCFNAEGADQLHCLLEGTRIPHAAGSSRVTHLECKHKRTQKLPPGLSGTKGTTIELMMTDQCHINRHVMHYCCSNCSRCSVRWSSATKAQVVAVSLLGFSAEVHQHAT